MAKILHQLRLVVYPIIYRVLYGPGEDGTGFLPSTVCTGVADFSSTYFWARSEGHGIQA